MPSRPRSPRSRPPPSSNISRPSLIQLLDEGKLPYRRIGTHRPIPLEAVLAYKAEAYAKRKGALDEMSALHQELGLE